MNNIISISNGFLFQNFLLNNVMAITTSVNPIRKKMVHILDGGTHGDYMKHFAKSVMGSVKDIEIKFHNAVINPKDKGAKQMGALRDQLRELNNSSEIKAGDFVSLPGVAYVTLLNLKDRIRDILHRDVWLTPENVKDHKSTILELLKEIENNKWKYSQQLEYMDPNSQDLGSTYGVIQEINALVAKGVHVYVPAGHANDNTIKWMAGRDGVKNELYHNIEHKRNIDTLDYPVKKLFNEAKDNNFYDFNLLALSDAKIVNVKDVDNNLNYIFSSKDKFVTDGIRGVYNFYPVRDIQTGDIKGYSFQDKKTVEYPYEAFPFNDKLVILNKFVGKKVEDCLASAKEHALLREMIKNGKNTENLNNKLFNINEVCDDGFINHNKPYLLGKFTDSSRKLVFDASASNEILFHKTNCEGTDRPSVFSMWGCCFATFNAIKKDVVAQIEAEEKAMLEAIKQVEKLNAEKKQENTEKTAKPQKTVPFAIKAVAMSAIILKTARDIILGKNN